MIIIDVGNFYFKEIRLPGRLYRSNQIFDSMDLSQYEGLHLYTQISLYFRWSISDAKFSNSSILLVHFSRYAHNTISFHNFFSTTKTFPECSFSSLLQCDNQVCNRIYGLVDVPTDFID